MSFLSDFKTIIEGIPSVSAVTGGIKYVHLPEDFDIRKNWLVWDFRMVEQLNTINFNDAYSNYSISITITSTDSVTCQNISDTCVSYLNGKTTTNFPDIYLISDSKQTTLSKPANTYQNTLEFGAIYTG